MDSAKRFRPSGTASWIILLSLIWAIIFALDLLPILHGGPPDWDWHYKPVLERYRIAPLVLSVIIYVPVGLWLRKRLATAGLLAWAILGGICLSLAAVHARGEVLYRLYTITVSGRAAGWHMAAVRISDLSSTLRNWPQFMQESSAYSPHIDHSPPGIVIIYYSANRLLERVPNVAEFLARPLRWLLCQYLTGYDDGQYASAWLGMLTPVWAALTALPIMRLCRKVYGDEAARWSVLWWPLVPGLLLFAPLPNALYALPSLATISVLWDGLTNDRAAGVVVAGFLMSLLTFLSFTFAPLLLFAGLLTLGAHWLRIKSDSGPRARWQWPIRMGLCFGLGLSGVWLIYFAITGSSFVDMWRAAQQTQQDVAGVRPYVPWLPLNLNDLFMFTGWPVALLAIAAISSAVRRVASTKAPNAADVMTLSAALTLLLIDLYGTPRGEWGRILLFFSPWLLFAAARKLREAPNSGWLFTGMQGAVAIVMVACLQVLAPEFKAHAAPVPPSVKYPASNPQVYSASANFGEHVRLVAVSGRTATQLDANSKEQGFLYIWLTWDAIKRMNIPYAYQVETISSDGVQSSGPAILIPFSDSYPTTCWKPDEGPLTDRIKVPLVQPASGDLWVDLALIDPATNQVLEVAGGDVASNQVRLGPFH